MKKLAVFRICAAVFLVVLFAMAAMADGDETLGTPSIPIAAGSGYVANGVGLTMHQPGVININVPVPSTVRQVLLYWEGQHYTGYGDHTIHVDGTEITGDVIGGPNYFFNDGGNGGPPIYSTTLRADITSLGLVQPGANALSISGLAFQKANNGAGIVVIYDDGTELADIQLVDGNDLAYKFFPPPRDATVPQTFTFLPSNTDRVAKLAMFFSSVQGTISTGQQRPNRISVTVGGVTTDYDNVLNSNDGEEWDTYEINVNVPAGETSVTVEPISGPGGSPTGTPDPRPASLAWITAGFSIPPPCSGQIGDFIWKDCNGNGIQDPNEAGIANVTVYLKDINGNILATTTTDANGLYYFNNLCLGNYIVEVDETTMPPGLTQTTCSNAPGIANNSNCSPSPVSLTLNNSVDLTIDFGYKGNGLIGDFVWADANCDGIQDLGENGLSNVTVWLKQNGIIVKTAVTDANGKYEFTGLCGGNYVVEVDTTTLPPNARLQTTCDDAPGIADNSNCSPTDVVLIDGQVDRTIDFGYCTTTICLQPPASSPCPTEGTFMIPQVLPNGDLLLYFEQSTGINDNTYGTNIVGWGAKTHTFSNLVGSDKAQFVFYNGTGQKVLDIIVDYISAKSGTPSGYASLGVTGGDGRVNLGSAAHVLMATTSLDYNLNSLGLCVGGNCTSGGVNLLVNSPPTTGPNSYAVANPIHSGWVFPITYTVRIAAAAFGPSGFGRVELPAIHNSPPKCGTNAITYGPCEPGGTTNPDVCADGIKPGTLRFMYTGEDCSTSNNSQGGKATCTDLAPLQPTVRILVIDKSNPADNKAKKWFDGVVNLGETFEVKASNGGATRFPADTYYYIYSTGGQLLQSGKFHTSCSQPLLVGNQFGSLSLVGFLREGTNPGSACEFNVKPGTLNMIYTGLTCAASNNTQGGKATCTDHAALQGSVRVVMIDKSNPSDNKAKKWFDGIVNIGDTVVAKASNGGKAEFGKDMHYFIYSTGGQLLQSGKFKTDCNQPLFVGDQFGALRLVGFKPRGVPKMIEDLEGMPEAYRLLQNYPNPFNPQTEIYFQMPEGGNMTLKIFNTLGQEVKTLVDGYMDAGIHGVTWDATDNNGLSVSSGIYFYQMRSGDFSSMKKMSLLR